MKRLMITMAVVALVLAGQGRRAQAVMIHEVLDPAATATSYKDYGVAFNKTLIDGEDWSQIKFLLYSDYYYSSGDATWNCSTTLTHDTSVQIAVIVAEAEILAPGDNVSGARSYSTDTASFASYFRYKSAWDGWYDPSYAGPFGGGSTVDGYLGLQLNDGANTYYGWMHVDVTGGARQTMNIYEYAINLNPDEGILVGQTESVTTPEPASMSLLAVGGASLLMRRRRR